VSDRVAMIVALAALSIPVFVVALVSLALFLQFTGVYAGNRYVPLTEDPLGWLSAMWLPWICLAFPLIAVYARMVRSSVLEVQGEEYIRTSWAKGLTEKQVFRHELRSGLTPIVTMYGLDFGLLLGGSVIIETIFRIPGLGTLLLQARTFYDFPLMSGIVILFSAMVIAANLVVDLLYGWLDPRVGVEAAPGPPRPA
jgi:peptide/nickel transport system permease protein